MCGASRVRCGNGVSARKFRSAGTAVRLVALTLQLPSCRVPDGARETKPKIVAAANAAARQDAKASNAGASHNGNGWSDLFSRTACVVAHWMGKPVSFLIATALVIVWALTGPLFGYSDTWQLVINTSTTIVTFLMVFLIQNTQNRDTMALQLKLSELILVIERSGKSLCQRRRPDRRGARAAAQGTAGARAYDARRAQPSARRADQEGKLSRFSFGEPDGRRDHDQHESARADRHEGRPGRAGQVPGKPAQHRRDHRERIADREHRARDAMHVAGWREQRRHRQHQDQDRGGAEPEDRRARDDARRRQHDDADHRRDRGRAAARYAARCCARSGPRSRAG